MHISNLWFCFKLEIQFPQSEVSTYKLFLLNILRSWKYLLWNQLCIFRIVVFPKDLLCLNAHKCSLSSIHTCSCESEFWLFEFSTSEINSSVLISFFFFFSWNLTELASRISAISVMLLLPFKFPLHQAKDDFLNWHVYLK